VTYRVSGDPSKPRSWSKYANDSSLNKNNETNVKSSERSIESVGKDNTERTETKKHNQTKKKTEKEENTEVKKALEKV